MRARRAARKEKRNGRGCDRSFGRPRIVGRAAACLAFFAVLCVMPVYVNSAIGYVPALAYAAVVAISFAYPRVLARHLACGLLLDRRSLFRDTEAKLLVRFSNPLPLVCPRIDAEVRVSDIFGGDDTVSGFSLSLGPGRSRDFELGVRFAHIGTVSAGVKTVVVYDPFGFSFCTVRVDDDRQIEVLPRIYPVDASLVRSLSLQEAMDSRIPFNRDGMDYSDVREYEYGDPLKAIHWKLSSHSSTLYTRLFETVGNPEIDILCGTGFGEGDSQMLMSLYDAELEAALSVYEFGFASGLHMRLAFGDGAGGVASFDSLGKPDRLSILRSFPLPRPGRGDRILPDILQERSGGAGGGNFVVCTALLDDALVDALASIDKGRCRIVLFFLMPTGAGSAERRELMRPLRRLEQDNVTCFALTSASEIAGVSYE